MKKINIIVSALVIAIAIGSCDDAQDIVQAGELQADQFIESDEDLSRAIIGLHSALPSQGEIQFVSTFTDELSIGNDNGGQGITNDALYAFNLNPATGLSSGIWTGHYSLIADINFIIEEAEANLLNDLVADSDEEDDYNYNLAVCHTLRAYAYTKLLSYYSEDPENDSALAIPLVDFVPEVNNADDFITLDRSTVGEISAFIEEDIETAQDFFDEDDNLADRAGADRTFIDNQFLRATNARFLNTTGEFEDARTEALAALGDSGLSSLSLAFFDVWTDEGVEGIIFKKEQTQNDAEIGAYFNSQQSSTAGVQVFEWGRAVFNLFNGGDIRLAAWLDGSSMVDANYQSSSDPRNSDILVIDKYPGSGDFNLVNDIKIFRGAEMLLIAAEASARQSNPDLATAAGLINTLRAQRSGMPTPVNYNTVDEALEDILEERRKELWLEGHRYLDMKRIGREIGASFEKDPVDCQVANVVANCELDSSDDRLTLPIPQVEISANPTITQNTGY